MSTQKLTRKRVLSGIRATGRLHLGNYLGAVKGMLALAGLRAKGQGLRANKEYETLYMIADLHTTTTPFSPEELRKNRLEVAMDYLAAGLDPKQSIIFAQSDLADLHTQLAFYFSTVVSVARMQHLPTFKDKIKQYPHHVTMALLNYPVLMAADILIYKASKVPVGIDQEPHLEIAREIARKMNEMYGTDFPEPTRFATSGEYVPSLAGEGKMSKSVEGSYINLTDDLATIQKRLASAPTDSGKGQIETGDRDREFVSNGKVSTGVAALLKFVELFQGGERRAEYERQYTSTGIRYGDLKKELAEAIYKELEPIQRKRKEFESDPAKVEKILAEGADRARAIAEKTVREVRKKMGLL
jgi:tryptophanyl-tRNA synthetase